MRAQVLAQTIAAHFNIGRETSMRGMSLMIEGSPGGGKTQIPQQVAKELGIGCILFNVPTRPTEDYAVPVPIGDKLTFATADELPFEGSSHPEETLLIADELAGGDNDKQKMWMSLIQDRQLHGKKLKEGCMIVATGNDTTDRAGANRLLTPLADRLTRYAFEVNVDDWCNWALDHDVHEAVVAAVRFMPDLFSFDPNAKSNGTPRSWSERVSPFIGKVPDEFASFSGAVGEGNAARFLGFLGMYRDLPNPDAIIMDPDRAEVPTKPDILYAITGAVAKKSTEVNFERVMKFLKRLPPEFMVLGVRDAARADRAVLRTKAYVDWTCKEGAGVLL